MPTHVLVFSPASCLLSISPDDLCAWPTAGKDRAAGPFSSWFPRIAEVWHGDASLEFDRVGTLVLAGRLDGTGRLRPGSGSGRAGRKFALLAGVRQYKTPALRTLNYPDRDVEELAKVLVEAGFSGDESAS